MFRRVAGCWLSSVLAIVIGCSGATHSPPASGPNNPAGAASTATAGAANSPAITARVLSIAETEQLIASCQGKVVVVDLWALW